MKSSYKFLLPLVAIVTMFWTMPVRAQISSFPWSIGFETGQYDMSGWIFIDADGDGYGWDTTYLRGQDDQVHTGTGMIASSSYYNSTALTPNNWLISPEFAIPAGSSMKLSWWERGQDPSYYDEYYSVYISTDSAVSSFLATTAVFQGTATNEWVKRTVSLDDYAGQTIRFAFRHWNVTDMFWLDIDDIEITQAGMPEVTMPAMATVYVNDTLVISATASGAAPLAFSWSSLMAASGDATMSNVEGELTIVYTASGIDTVMLEVSNAVGADTAYAVVQVVDLDPVVEYPYSTGFEVGEDVNWITNNSVGPNGWYIGSAVANESSRSLYVSNDNGTTNAYNFSWTSDNYACRAFVFEAGDYTLSLNWKAVAESGNWDYMHVYLAPGSVDMMASIQPAADWTSLSGNLNQQSTWQTLEEVFHVDTEGTYYIVFRWVNDYSMGSNPPAAVDNVVVNRLSCSAPSALHVDSITSTGIEIAWTAGEESAWQVSINDSLVTVTTNPYFIEDLNPNTPYTVTVRAICDQDDTSFWSESVATRTLTSDVVATVPFVCSFEDDDVNATWVLVNAPTNAWQIGTAVNNGGSHALYISNDNGISNAYTVSADGVSYAYQTLQMQPGEYAFSFDWKAEGEGNYDFLRFAISPFGTTLPNSYGSWGTTDVPAGFTALDGGMLNQQNHWQSMSGTFNIENSGVYNIYLVWRNDYSVGTQPPAAIDNFQIVQNTCPQVHNLQVAYVSPDSITVSWTAGSSESAWVVSNGVDTVSNVTTTSYTFDNLSSNTVYPITVWAVCAADDVSMPATISARTGCGTITTLPWTENFDNLNVTSTDMIPCWNYMGGGYVYTSTDNAFSGNSLVFKPNGSSSTDHILVLPEFDTVTSGLELSLWIRPENTSGYSGSFSIGYVTNVDSAASFVEVLHLESTTMTTDFVEVEVAFNGAPDDARIALRHNVSSTYYYWFIDNVDVHAAPLCPVVSGITVTDLLTTSATIHWVDGVNSGWNVEYDSVEFTPGTGHMTAIHVTDTFCALTGLNPATHYHVYIYPDCSGVYPRHAAFTTLAAAPASLPYSCDFEAAGSNGWDFICDGQTNYWIVGSATHNGGSQSLYVTNDGTSNSYATSPTSATSHSFASRVVDITDAGSYLCTYDWRSEGESTYDFLRVALVPASTQLVAGTYSGFNSSSAVPAGGIALDGGQHLGQQSTWQTHVQEFQVTTPGTYKIVFLWRNDGSVGTQPPAAIDNVTLQLNSCPMVTDIHAVNVGTTTLTVDWTDNTTGVSQWEVRYSAEGGTATTLSVTSHPVDITGLEALTEYSFRVRPICSATDTGGWSLTAALSTDFCDNATIVATGDPDATTATSNVAPVDNYYKYTLSETIIDSAELGGQMEITDIAYYYDYSLPTTAKTDVTIWLQPTAKSEFDGSTDIVTLDTTIAVMVYQGSLNCSQGWNYFSFTNSYNYDGNGNLLVIVDDNSNGYDGGSYVFKTAATTAYKTLAYYHDVQNPNPLDPSGFTGTHNRYQWRPVMRLVSCNTGCPKPVVTSTEVTYGSVTVNWSGSDVTEVKIQQGLWDAAAGTAQTVTTGTVTFGDLTPATAYTVGLRNVCDDGTYSAWQVIPVTTDDLPCLVPTGLHVVDLTTAGGTVAWTAGGEETSWEVNITGTNYNSTFTVNGTPSFIATDLYQGVTYSVIVRAMCATTVYSDWSAPITLTPTSCERPTGVAVTVSGTNATVTWNGTADRYMVAYGEQGSGIAGAEFLPVAGATSATLTGLEAETAYEVSVRAYCGDDISLWSDVVYFTTGTSGIDGVEGSQVNLYPNPASTMVTLDGIEGEAQVTLVDMNGRVVYTQSLSHSATQSLKIDLTGMAKGAYFVRITGERTNAIRKLIVK